MTPEEQARANIQPRCRNVFSLQTSRTLAVCLGASKPSWGIGQPQAAGPRAYHGVLAPSARDRGRIVPAKPVEESTAADRDSSAPPCAHRPGLGGPARPRVFCRPKRMGNLWRAPENHRRPDALTDTASTRPAWRSRAGGDAPAEGPCLSRCSSRLTSSAMGPLSRREACALKVPGLP